MKEETKNIFWWAVALTLATSFFLFMVFLKPAKGAEWKTTPQFEKTIKPLIMNRVLVLVKNGVIIKVVPGVPLEITSPKLALQLYRGEIPPVRIDKGKEIKKTGFFKVRKETVHHEILISYRNRWIMTPIESTSNKRTDISATIFSWLFIALVFVLFIGWWGALLAPKDIYF